MPAKKKAESAEVAEPAAEEKPSGFIVSTARAFNPSRVGIGKTIGAIGLVVANVAFFFAIDAGFVPANGMTAVFLSQVFGGTTMLAVRHLGSRWKTDE